MPEHMLATRPRLPASVAAPEVSTREWSSASPVPAPAARGRHDLANIAVSASPAGGVAQRMRTPAGAPARGEAAPLPGGGVIQRARGKLNLQTLFPDAPQSKLQDYRRISDMLEDSTRVQAHLEQLNASMDGEPDGLHGALNTMEKGSGFKPPVAVSALLTEPQFMAHVADKRHLVDPGAMLKHGPLTHRIQWWMVQNEMNQAAKSGTPFNHAATDLYTGLGDKEFRFAKGVETKTAWDAMFDRNVDEGVDRASRPEWLHPQMLNMGGEGQVLDTTRFPKLHSALKGEYDVAHDPSKGSEGEKAWNQNADWGKVDNPHGMIGQGDKEFDDALAKQDAISQTAPRVKINQEHSLGPLPKEEPIGNAVNVREAARARVLKPPSLESEPVVVHDQTEEDPEKEEEDKPEGFLDDLPGFDVY